MLVPSLGREAPLEKEMAIHSSILAWRIPWTEEPGRLVYGVSKSQRTRLKRLSTHAGIQQQSSWHMTSTVEEARVTTAWG